MKKRTGFVSNSSSTGFFITNKTNKTLTLVDFVKENPQLLEDFKATYYLSPHENYTQETLIQSAQENNEDLPPGTTLVAFGDEQGTIIGEIFDYALRDGGESKRFIWTLHEYYR